MSSSRGTTDMYEAFLKKDYNRHLYKHVKLQRYTFDDDRLAYKPYENWPKK